MKRKRSSIKKIIIIAAAVLFVLTVTFMLYRLVSYIPALIFLLLSIVFGISLAAARDVLEVELAAEKLNPDITVKKRYTETEAELKPVVVELETSGEMDGEGFYKHEIPFSEFFDGQITLGGTGKQERPFGQDNSIRIEFKYDKNFEEVEHRPSGNGSLVLRNYLKFEINTPPRSNKFVIAGVMVALIAVFTTVCWVFNAQFEKSNEDIRYNLDANLSAISSDSTILLTEQEQSEEQVYYKELPEVQLLVITKDQKTFLPAKESMFYNPEYVNTVLMLYEDNFSGCRDLEETDEEAAKRAAANATHYNITELYMNLPVVLEDGETYSFGELFEHSGYQAVKDFFRDAYHINIASVTEIPEAVFAECFGTEERTAINVNRNFVRFMYDNYYTNPDDGAVYSSNAVKAMLTEGRPYYPAVLQSNLAKLTAKMGLHSEQGSTANAMLFLDGSSMMAFGNSVRVIGDHTEYEHLTENGYYQNPADYPVEEWDTVQLSEIVHSNWDIVLVNVLEGISNMNNGTYTVLCKETHQESLGTIRSSLDGEVLREFLTRLTTSNTVLGDEESQHDFVFSVRNLDLGLETTLGENNVYLQSSALKIAPYTNRQVKKTLYYCLIYPKKVS